MIKFLSIPALLILSLLTSGAVIAKGVYQNKEDFISEAFSDAPPEVSRLWLKQDERKTASNIMQRKIPLRIKHWQKDSRTAWILEEIGKEKPITTGIIIQQGKIEKLKVLIFRESRGWEVRYPFFTDQFITTRLQPTNNKLNKAIDGITGATLSVRALNKLARLALFLDQLVVRKTE
jgi:hypothetical protein